MNRAFGITLSLELCIEPIDIQTFKFAFQPHMLLYTPFRSTGIVLECVYTKQGVGKEQM